MARNHYYRSNRKTIFLEFNTLVGTDSIFFIDGRWNNDTVEYKVIKKAREIRKRRPHLQLVGWAIPGDYSRRICNFPSYVLNAANKDLGE